METPAVVKKELFVETPHSLGKLIEWKHSGYHSGVVHTVYRVPTRWERKAQIGNYYRFALNLILNQGFHL